MLRDDHLAPVDSTKRRVTSRYCGWIVLEQTTRWALLPFTRRAMSAASASAVAPSYIDALTTSIASSSETSVWNSKMICSVPCAISG